jgi:hypothetical protein
MEVKERDNPNTIASGLSFPFPVEYAKTAGIMGRMHGESTLTIPAKKAAIGKKSEIIF